MLHNKTAEGLEQVEHPAIPEEQVLQTVLSLYSFAPQLSVHFRKSTAIYFVQVYTQLSPSS